MRLVDRSELGDDIVRKLVARTARARSVAPTAMHAAIQEDHGYSIEVAR